VDVPTGSAAVLHAAVSAVLAHLLASAGSALPQGGWHESRAETKSLADLKISSVSFLETGSLSRCPSSLSTASTTAAADRAEVGGIGWRAANS